ncbi:LamG domain-containing protein [Candidatus Poribacteria bacterium]|nr:LamG domain-containing protein [Candidatus Poribacteria bacterium]
MQKSFLFLLSFILVFSCFQSISAQVDKTTILWYKFDEEVKGEVTDISQYKNNGIVVGRPGFENKGKVGGAIKFAPGASIKVPITDSLNVEKNLTIEFWVMPDKVPAATYWRMLHKGWVSNGSYICGIDNNWMALGYTWDVNNMLAVRKDANMANAVVAGTWQYYTGTYDGTNIILWIDGEPLVKTAADGKINGAFDIIIAENFSGLMDELRFSNVALDQDTIKKRMAGESPGGRSVDPKIKLPITWGEIKDPSL